MTLPPLKEVIQRHGLMTKKALGQHFLLDARLMQRIVSIAGAMEGVTAIEIGPGPGGLTRELLQSNTASVVAIEMDARCLPVLAELSDIFPGKLTVHYGDAMKIDLPAITKAPRKIVANLPYNVSAVLLARWLGDIHTHGAEVYAGLTLMFQKEVAQRIMAAPGSKTYGRLSVISQWLCDVQMGFDIPPGAFLPPPKVTSSVIHLTPRRQLALAPDFTSVEAVTKAAFGQRRKMLRSALKTLSPHADALMERAGIDPTLRAEQITVDRFLRLAMEYQRDFTKPSSPT